MRYHRLVLDTSIIVAGLRSQRGASFVVLSLVAQRRIVPLLTTALFLEYEEVLLRPEQRLATGMSEQDIGGFLSALASAAEAVEVHFRWRPQLRDADDELVLEAAVNGNADALITHNLDDFREGIKTFSIPAITPGNLLKELDP